MATHTEPSGRHTKEELMHPGRDHHLKQTSTGELACPDPSVHRDTRLQEQASTAALYATSPGKKTGPQADLLDKNGKLSSAGMYTRHIFSWYAAHVLQALPRRSNMPPRKTSPAFRSLVSTQTLLAEPHFLQTQIISSSSTGSPIRLRAQALLRCLQRTTRWHPCGSLSSAQPVPRLRSWLTRMEES